MAPPSLLAAAVGVLMAAALLAGNAHFSANTGAGHLSYSTCANEESNATLIQLVVYLYEGNGNASGSGSGLINQGPPGPSAYPPEAVAESNVIAGWHAVCQSSVYYALVQQWGAPNYPINANAQNHSGVYEEVVAVTWQATNSSCAPNSNPHGPCMGTAQWLINVASGAVSGPTTTYYVIQTPI
jgi:hypothetical protein